MNTKVTTLLAMPVLAAGASVVHAQGSTSMVGDEGPKFSVRLGATQLENDFTKNRTGRNGFTAAAGYRVGQLGRAEIEFMNTSRGDKVKALGLNFTQMFPFKKEQFLGTGKGGYAAIGIGVYRVTTEFAGASGVAAINGSGTRVGGKVLLGYQFNSRYFAEAAFNQVGAFQGGDPSNFSLSVGARF